MDFLKKGADMLNKNKASGSTEQQASGSTGASAQGQAAGGQASGGQDYGDKAFDFISKKTGYKVDPNTSEKITDGARGLYEKQSGKKVDPKWSN